MGRQETVSVSATAGESPARFTSFETTARPVSVPEHYREFGLLSGLLN